MFRYCSIDLLKLVPSKEQYSIHSEPFCIIIHVRAAIEEKVKVKILAGNSHHEECAAN
jgi:hypothetical protein